MGSRTAIVIPCYNEEERLKKDEFLEFLKGPGASLQMMLFVNDGSTDATLEVLESLKSELPARIEVINCVVNGGKAEAVRQGLLAAIEIPGVQYVGFWDADLATPLYHILDFVKVAEEKPQIEMIFGARVALLGRKIKRKLTRHYLGRVFATLVSICLRLGIYDTQCGAKLFRCSETLRAVLQVPFRSKWVFDVEIIARYQMSRRNSCEEEKVHNVLFEFPLLEWKDVGGSKLNITDIFGFFTGLGYIFWNYTLTRNSHAAVGKDE